MATVALNAKKPAPRAGGRGMLANPDRRFWRHWYLLSGTLIVTTVGLAVTAVSLLWPWTGGDLFLLTVLSLSVFAFVGYLTFQQRHFVAVRSELEEARKNEIQQKYMRVFELLNMSRIMDPDTKPSSVFDGIVKMCIEIFGCEKASLMLAAADGENLEVMAAAGYMDRKIVGAKQKIGDGIAGWAAKHLKPVLLMDPKDARKYPGLEFKARAVSAAIVVPIIVRKRLLGVLNISTRDRTAYYDDDDLRALQAFSRQVGAWILQTLTAQRMRARILELEQARAR